MVEMLFPDYNSELGLHNGFNEPMIGRAYRGETVAR